MIQFILLPELNDSYLELLAAVGFSNLKVTELKSNIIKVHTKKAEKNSSLHNCLW